jgi:hypothetical protein
MKDLPHARAAAAGRAVVLGPNIPFKRLHVFAWSDDCPFPVFSLITIAHFA